MWHSTITPPYSRKLLRRLLAGVVVKVNGKVIVVSGADADKITRAYSNPAKLAAVLSQLGYGKKQLTENLSLR